MMAWVPENREKGENFPFLDEMYPPISSGFQWKEKKRLGDWQMFHFYLLQTEFALEILKQVLLILSKWNISLTSFQPALH